MQTSPWAGRDVSKDQIRDHVWSQLVEANAVYDNPIGAIPDFVGKEEAAQRLATLDIWTSAKVVKCTPDSCQAPIRLQALRDGKLLYMAYPRLAVYPCFIELDPARLSAAGLDLEQVSTMDGAIAHGRPVPFEEMQHIDLVNVGCVAVTRDGGRTGKGAGFADLELGLLREHGLVDETTPVATTVHPLSLIDDGMLPMTDTDSPLDWIVTVDEVIATGATGARPSGIRWDLLQPDQIEVMPVLQILDERRRA